MSKEETGMAPILVAKSGFGKRGLREGGGRQCLGPAAKKERGGAEGAQGWEVALDLTLERIWNIEFRDVGSKLNSDIKGHKWAKPYPRFH